MEKFEMSNEITTHQSFIVAMPDSAPPLGFDPEAETFNWREVYPSNYLSMDELEEHKKLRGGWPVLMPGRVVIKPVYDPAEYEGKEVPPEELAPKVVLEWQESFPALVFNKSRCEMATQITGTPNPRKWVQLLGPLVLSVGVYNKKAQVIIEPAPTNDRAKNNGQASHITEDDDIPF
jgi:hypothetical protein